MKLTTEDKDEVKGVTEDSNIVSFPQGIFGFPDLKTCELIYNPQELPFMWLQEQEKGGLAFNELVRKGEVKAPIVIGRDHLDAGSVASPNRETEAMKDGSDAVADWPILNALLSTSGGTSWTSVHHGGGVGMGLAIHAGIVIVADGTPEMKNRLNRVLTNDPGLGVARHADAGYEKAVDIAKVRKLKLPMIQ